MLSLFPAALSPDLIPRFLHYSLLRMRPLATIVLGLATAEFAMFALAGGFLTASRANPWLLLAIFLGLSGLTYGAAKARSANHFGWVGIAFVALLEWGTVLNSSGNADPLTWALPAIILVPIGAGPIWLTRRDYVIGTVGCWLTVLPFISSLSLTPQNWTVFGMYVILSGTLSYVLHALFCGYRRESFVLEIRLADMASLDALTGVPNRRYFFEKANAMLRSCAALGEPANAVFVDIDHFKSLNDGYGHAAGDEALRDVAQT
ncbi:MAG: diguanylate cyclase, partial [Pseudomonadota bacterium]